LLHLFGTHEIAVLLPTGPAGSIINTAIKSCWLDRKFVMQSKINKNIQLFANFAAQFYSNFTNFTIG
jgi:hypothetical protein